MYQYDEYDEYDEDDDDDEIKYYLYECNHNRDIENNIGEVKAPEFTMEDIIIIDEKYKRCYEKLVGNAKDYTYIILDINELYMEHRNNVARLITMMNEYNSMYTRIILNQDLTTYEKMNKYMVVRSKQIHMYFQEIEPVLNLVNENLFELMEVTR
jgi:hypothetical protein